MLEKLYQNLILDEIKFYQKINPNYMSTQEKINDKMRAILVDWLVGLHYKLNLKKKTLFLCVFIIWNQVFDLHVHNVHIFVHMLLQSVPQRSMHSLKSSMS